MKTNKDKKNFLRGKILFFDSIIPKEVKFLIKTLENHNREVYIIGGAVRNYLLDYPIKEYDLATDAIPEEIIEWLNEVGIKTRKIGSKYGTVLAIVGKKPFDVSTFRSEQFKKFGEPPEVTFVKDLKEDLARRDFRINALTYDPKNKKIIDLYDGLKDIHQKKIRFIGTPSRRLNEDGLRVIRLARFISEYDLSIDTNLKEEIIEIGNNIPFRRYKALQKEFFKLLKLNNPSAGLILLLETSVLNIIFPPLFTIVSEKELSLAKTRLSKLSEIPPRSELTRLFGLIILINDFSSITDNDWSMIKKKLNFSLKQKQILDRISQSWETFPQSPDFNSLKSWIRSTGINTSEDLLKLIFLNAELNSIDKLMKYKQSILEDAEEILFSFRYSHFHHD